MAAELTPDVIDRLNSAEYSTRLRIAVDTVWVTPTGG